MNLDRRDRRLERSMLYLGQRRVATNHGNFVVHFFRDLAHDRSAMAIVRGQTRGPAPLLVRVHSSCLTSECLAGRDCDCAEQLDGALEMMARAGDGVLFYLMQEGRGAGLTAKARDRMIVQASENQKTTFDAYAEMGLPPDLRRYDLIKPISRLLGIETSLRLLTNNPDKAVAVTKAFAEEGIEVCRTERIQIPSSPFNLDYLAAKHDSGHAFNRPARSFVAKPPLPVRVVSPFALPGDRRRVLTASYFLPIALPAESTSPFPSNPPDPDVAVEWFRLSVFFDGLTAQESIVLSHRESNLDEVVEVVAGNRNDFEPITMSLIDRLPVGNAVGRKALGNALIAIRRRGRGCVAVSFDDRDCAEEFIDRTGARSGAKSKALDVAR